MSLTKERIADLAPDAKSIKVAEGLANVAFWKQTGITQDNIWGLFQGSSATPYQSHVDLKTARFDCSCPSRKRPCKHALALALIHAANPNAIQEAAAPAWLALTPSDSLEQPPKAFPDLPNSWKTQLSNELEQDYMKTLAEFLQEERKTKTVFPPHQAIFNALNATAYDDVKVLILGQDPYHGAGQAHGLSFSVQEGVRIPPSLQNMFRELQDDLGFDRPESGNLQAWAQQGVLLLNAVLTVRQAEANSHKGKGWERFTDKVIESVNQKESPVVFVLWGNYAQKKRSLIDETKHHVIATAHPSPLSAHNGFLGSKPYSKINEILENTGQEAIDWDLEDMPF